MQASIMRHQHIHCPYAYPHLCSDSLSASLGAIRRTRLELVHATGLHELDPMFGAPIRAAGRTLEVVTEASPAGQLAQFAARAPQFGHSKPDFLPPTDVTKMLSPISTRPPPKLAAPPTRVPIRPMMPREISSPPMMARKSSTPPMMPTALSNSLTWRGTNAKLHLGQAATVGGACSTCAIVAGLDAMNEDLPNPH
jgi:hypothetical protein